MLQTSVTQILTILLIYVNPDGASLNRHLQIQRQVDGWSIQTCDVYEGSAQAHCMSLVPDRALFKMSEILRGLELFLEVARKGEDENRMIDPSVRFVRLLTEGLLSAPSETRTTISFVDKFEVFRFETALRYILDGEMRHAACERYLFQRP